MSDTGSYNMRRNVTPCGAASAGSVMLALILSACTPASAVPTPENISERDQFWAALQSHCGKAYAGGLVSEDARDADMQDAAMVMHVRDCSDTRVAIPFQNADEEAPEGWNRSRTWVLTRGPDGAITLKHEHRHEDGSLDAVTNYGGTTAEAGTATVQQFPVDAESIATFTREGLDASLTNVWQVEVTDAGADRAYFAYQLTRRNDETRLFRVRFDADEAVEERGRLGAPRITGRTKKKASMHFSIEAFSLFGIVPFTFGDGPCDNQPYRLRGRFGKLRGRSGCRDARHRRGGHRPYARRGRVLRPCPPAYLRSCRNRHPWSNEPDIRGCPDRHEQAASRTTYPAKRIFHYFS